MVIGIDLGGTSIRAALVTDGEVRGKVETPCPSQAAEGEVLDAIFRVVDSLVSPQVEAIGAGIPSIVDRERGIVYNAANIPSWREVHLKDAFQHRYGIRTSLNNDSNCFALGVGRAGEGRGYSDFIAITLGTGVGAGVVVGGSLYNWCNTSAGEIGSLGYLGQDYEYYCGSAFFKSRFHASGKEMATRARGGDTEAMQAWRQFGGHVGELVKAAMLTYDPPATGASPSTGGRCSYAGRDGPTIYSCATTT